VFAVDPESLYRGRVLNFTRKSHKAIYTAATKSLYADNADRYDLNTANAQNFLQRVQDCCLDSSLGILEVPRDYKELDKLGRVPDSQIYFLNICESHRSLTHQAMEVILGQEGFSVDHHGSGNLRGKWTSSNLMLLKTILDKSPINSLIDPDVIRKELANANLKFKEL
jgi:hypothetical protein